MMFELVEEEGNFRVSTDSRLQERSGGVTVAVDYSVCACVGMVRQMGVIAELQACAIYNNWWPMLAALMYVMVPMLCLFFRGGSIVFLTSRDGGGTDAMMQLYGGDGGVGLQLRTITSACDAVK
ncbi:hypothetical protein C5167_026408 [Papaver somniferum]|nr:hypothetical protein C5167_026408 [Papaver somniferum]